MLPIGCVIHVPHALQTKLRSSNTLARLTAILMQPITHKFLQLRAEKQMRVRHMPSCNNERWSLNNAKDHGERYATKGRQPLHAYQAVLPSSVIRLIPSKYAFTVALSVTTRQLLTTQVIAAHLNPCTHWS